MTKKQRKKNNFASSPGIQKATLREENVGRKHVDSGSVLRMQHLQRLAIWAGGEASISPLAALLGHRLAVEAEAEGIPLDRSFFSCQRCETILQPDYNCTMRIEKIVSGTRRRRKSGKLQNNVVYTCHFCSHRNVRGGLPKRHMKDHLSASGPIPESVYADFMRATVDKSDKYATGVNDLDGCTEYVNGSLTLSIKSVPEKEVASDSPAEVGSNTPAGKMSEKKMKINGCGSSQTANSGRSSATAGSGKDSSISGKRRRKGWSGLREITLSSEHGREHRLNNLAIPFPM
uniref:B-cell lymphoma/leukemia 11A n=1 Tax=Anthurium amnicola TaxID=1678845 RepID=A0A1D1Z655_9ARAE